MWKNAGWMVIASLLVACGGDEAGAPDADRNESFMAVMQGDGGKADALLIEDGTPEALGILAVANELDFDALDNDVSLDRRAAESIIVYREGNPDTTDDDRTLTDLDELDRIPWVGMRAFIKMYNFAQDNGYVERFRQPVLVCDATDQCGDGAVCVYGRCADVEKGKIDASSTDWIQSFGVSDSGQWWLRVDQTSAVTEIKGVGVATTDTETVEHPDGAPTLFLAYLPDRELTSLDRTLDGLVPEFGPKFELTATHSIIDLGYSPDGTLYALASTSNGDGTLGTWEVHRQTVLGWRLDHSVELPLNADQFITANLTFDEDAAPQLWLDNEGALTRYTRKSEGNWATTLTIDMVALGYSEKSWDRNMVYVDGNAGTSYFVVNRFAATDDLVKLVTVTGDDVGEIELTVVPAMLSQTPDGLLLVDDFSGSTTQVVDGVATSEKLEVLADSDGISVDGEGNIYSYNSVDGSLEMTKVTLRK